jgi:hypothetical protein
MFAQVNPLSINFVSRVVVGVFLLLAAVSKLGLFPSFVKTLTNFRVVPQRCAAPTALAVLLAEFTTGVFLVGGLQTRLASYSAIALLTCFTIAILTNLVRRQFDLECGCFGRWKKDRIGWHLLLRNTGLLGLTALSNLNTDARIHFFPRGIEGQGHIPEFLEH